MTRIFQVGSTILHMLQNGEADMLLIGITWCKKQHIELAADLVAFFVVKMALYK
jgi:hypothetical protein